MKTFRNLAFLGFVAVVFAVEAHPLEAFLAPPFNNCSDGCTCTVNPNNWLEVTGECPDAAPVDECPYGFDACDEYCDDLGPWMTTYYPPGSYSCGLWEFGGESCEGSLGFEPPTYWLCGCYCWVS